MKHPVEKLKGKEVIVVAQGVEYRGILIEVGADDVTISTETRWVLIPQNRISKIVSAEEPLKKEHSPSAPEDFWSEKFDPGKK